MHQASKAYKYKGYMHVVTNLVTNYSETGCSPKRQIQGTSLAEHRYWRDCSYLPSLQKGSSEFGDIYVKGLSEFTT